MDVMIHRFEVLLERRGQVGFIVDNVGIPESIVVGSNKECLERTQDSKAGSMCGPILSHRPNDDTPGIRVIGVAQN